MAPVHLIYAVRKLVDVFRLECGSAVNVLHANRPGEVREPQRKREQNFPGFGWMPHAAIQKSIMIPSTEAYVVVSGMEKAQHCKYPPFEKNYVSEKITF